MAVLQALGKEDLPVENRKKICLVDFQTTYYVVLQAPAGNALASPLPLSQENALCSQEAQFTSIYGQLQYRICLLSSQLGAS